MALSSPLAKVLFALFAFSLALFWFYGVYHTVFLVFSYTHRPRLPQKAVHAPEEPKPLPKAAIIYTTYNDFNEEAASSCLQQQYPDYRVFILDVSTSPEMRKMVDAFLQKHPSTTLVRLQPRQGFKARSLNDTLKTAVGPEYEFFAVCDADNYFPPDLLSRLLPFFSLDKRIAFVQAACRNSGFSQSRFAKAFEVAIDASWYLHQRPRDKYGILMCMGHGVVIRREAWERVGGYPEIVQEDTAFTMRLREHGYYGCFAPDVICGEEFPEDFRRFRRRQFRLVQADAEILSSQLPRFWANKNVSLIEKVDLTARTIRLPSQALTLPFLLLAFLFLPLANRGAVSADSINGTLGTLVAPVPMTATFLTAAAPLYAFFVHLRHNLSRLTPLLFHSIWLHYSLVGITNISLLVYLFRRRAMFLVTGTRDGASIQDSSQRRSQRLLLSMNADNAAVIALEALSGLILGSLGVLTGSLVLLGISLTLLVIPLVRHFEWQNKINAVFRLLPLTLVMIGLIGSFYGNTGGQSQFLALVILSVLLF